MALAPSTAEAYCGMLQYSGRGKTVEAAIAKANVQLQKQVRKLRKQSGLKLRLDSKSIECTGGAVAIDKSGRQTIGRPTCTLTQGFCVRPDP